MNCNEIFIFVLFDALHKNSIEYIGYRLRTVCPLSPGFNKCLHKTVKFKQIDPVYTLAILYWWLSIVLCSHLFVPVVVAAVAVRSSKKNCRIQCAYQILIILIEDVMRLIQNASKTHTQKKGERYILI